MSSKDKIIRNLIGYIEESYRTPVEYITSGYERCHACNTGTQTITLEGYRHKEDCWYKEALDIYKEKE